MALLPSPSPGGPGDQRDSQSQSPRTKGSFCSITQVRAKRWSASHGSKDDQNIELDAPTEDLTWLRDISTHLWSSDIFRSSTAHLSQLLGHSQYVIRDREQRLAIAALASYEKILEQVLHKLDSVCNDSMDIEGNRMQPRLFIRIRQYDETPIKMRVRTAEPLSTAQDSQDVKVRLEPLMDQVSQHDSKDDQLTLLTPPLPLPLQPLDTQTAKLFVTEMQMSALYHCQSHGALHLETQLPTLLQVLESNSQESICSALYLSNKRVYDELVNKGFPRLLTIVMSDSFSSNFVAERLLSGQEEHEYPSALWTKNSALFLCDIQFHVTCFLPLTSSTISDSPSRSSIPAQLTQLVTG